MGLRHNERETERGIKTERRDGGGEKSLCSFLALLHLAFLGRQCMFLEVCVHQI